MTVQELALICSLFLAGFALVRFAFVIPEALQQFGKFLVYDVYARILKNHTHKLVIVRLKGSDCHSPFVQNFACTLMSFNHIPTTLGESKEALLHLGGGEEHRIEERRLQALAGIYEYLLDEADSTSVWIEIQDLALGYCSNNLFMRIKPFRKEIVKEFLLSIYALSDSERDFIENYSRQHTAGADQGRDYGIAHVFPVEQST